VRLISDDALGVLTVWAEAEGESLMGKIAVAEVIQRRAWRRYNSDGTIAGTVARRFQFSFFNDDPQNNARLIRALQLDDSNQVVVDCREAWMRAKIGPAVVPDAVLYYAAGTPVPSWAVNCTPVGQIGTHLFFKVKV
jgi:spore germination cell wall hydrolase CwlJ-like protein